MPTHAATAENLRTLSAGRVVLALLAGLWLAGCSDSIRIDLEPESLGFEATVNGAVPLAKTVKATFTGAAVVVGYAPGQSKPDWLDITSARSDEDGTVLYRFSIKTTSLPASTYQTVVRFVTGNEEGTDFTFVDLPVTYTVRSIPKPFAVSPGVLIFSAASGQALPPGLKSVAVTANEAQPTGFSVDVSYGGSTRDWLTVLSRGTTPQTIDIGPNTTALPAGQYSATLLFTPDNDDPAIQVAVTYSVTSTTTSSFSVTPAWLEFTALAGQSSLPTAKAVNVSAQSGQMVSYSVSASYTGPRQDWLTLPSSGVTPQTLNIRPNTTALPSGQYNAVLTFTPTNDQPPVQVAVTYTLTGPGLSVSPTQLSFTASSGQSALPAAQTAYVSAQSGQSVNYSVSASYSGTRKDWLTLPPPGITSQTVSIRPNTTALPAGQYTAVLSFTPDNGQPAVQLTVTYTLTGASLAVAPTQLSFTASSGQSALPAAQTLNATGENGQAVNYSVTATYTGGTQGWLTLPPSAATPQTVSIRPNTTALPPGQYTAVLSFTPDNGQPAARLTVTYSLTSSDLRVNPSAPVLRVDANTDEAGLTSPVALMSTGAPLDWRIVAVSVNWLDIPPVSGNTQSQPALNLVLSKSALSAMDNGTYSGTVTLAYGNTSTAERQLDISVKLTIALPRVRTVTPYAIEAGRSLSHILRGEGFSGLQSGQTLRFGTTTTSTYQVVSDSEIRLNVPVLPAGTHLVTVDNTLGLSRPGPNLYAVQTPVLAETSIARTRGTRRVLYDPRRTAIYTVDYNSSNGLSMGLYRYRYVGGSWTEDPYVTLPDVYDAVMDQDGQSLQMAIGNGIYRLDLDDPTATPQYLRANWGSYNRLEILNDGYVMDMDSCYHAKASLDGRRAVIMDGGCYSPSGAVRTRDAGSTDIQYTRIYIYGPINYFSVDRTAHYTVIDKSIYNDQWTLVAAANDLRATIFSHDARRLFGFYADYDHSKQYLRVLDVSNPPTGGRFPQIAELLLAGAQPGDGNWYEGDKIITPDDRTMITVDSRQFHVIPLSGLPQ